MARIHKGMVYEPYTGKVYQAKYFSQFSNWYNSPREAVSEISYFQDWTAIFVKEYEDGEEVFGSQRIIENKGQSLYDIE